MTEGPVHPAELSNRAADAIDNRVGELEGRLALMERARRRHGWRSRWAAIGAAIAVSLGAGAVIQNANATIPSDPTSFVPVTPFRLFDSRPEPLNVGGWVGPLSPASSHSFDVAGEGAVPANAVGVVINVTAVGPTTNGHLRVYPTGEPLPNTSNVNFRAGFTTANLVSVPLGAGGKITVYSPAGYVHVIGDIAGYYLPSNDGMIALALPAAGSLIDGHQAWLDDATNDYVQYATVMPPDYVEGADLQAVLTWSYVGSACTVRLGFSDAVGFRAGVAEFIDFDATPAVTDASAGTGGGVESTTFTITPSGVESLQAGDTFALTFERHGTHTNDTCTNPIVVVSLTLRY